MSQFTLIWLVLGAFLNAVLLGVLPAYGLLLNALGVEAFTAIGPAEVMFEATHAWIPFGTVVSATVLAGVGLALLYISSRLDFVHNEHDPVKTTEVVPYLAFFFGLSWLCFLGIEMERYGERSGNALLEILLALPMVVLTIPSLLMCSIYVFVCTSLLLAGLITVPRSVRAYTRRHQLSGAWSQGIKATRFDGAAVVSALGDRTTSGAEGRKLHKDANQLQREVEAHVIALRAVRDKLRAEVLSPSEAESMYRQADTILARLAALNPARSGGTGPIRRHGD